MGSIILGWILALDSIAALVYLSAKLEVAMGGHAHEPGLGWWFLVVAVLLQFLAATMRTYAVLGDLEERRIKVEAHPIEDTPKPT